MRKLTLLFLFMAGLCPAVWAQLSIDASGTDYSIDFDVTHPGVNEDQYNGTGIVSAPATGQLNSNAWAVTGLSDGDSDFGDDNSSGDFARGDSPGGETSGGLYAFEVGTSNFACGVQPTAGDFTPGTFILRVQNNTGSAISSLQVDYNVVVFNNADRSSSFTFSYSFDNLSWTDVPTLDFFTPETADATPSWQTNPMSTTLTNLALADGSYFYIRWYSDDAGGSGSRDEFGMDDIVLNAMTGGNAVPQITNLSYNPQFPTSSDDVTVSAVITDTDGTINGAEIHWGLSSGNLPNTITMTNGGSGDTYTGTIPAQSDGSTVYFEIEAVDNDGGTTTSPEEHFEVRDPAITTLPYAESFDLDLGECYSFSVAGDVKVWEWNSNGYAQIYGDGGSDPEEDWLILPGIDLDNYSDEMMTFQTQFKYGNEDANNYLKLYFSTDYSGTGDPSSSNWTEISFTKPGEEETWTSSGDVDLSGITGSSVYLAFKYYSTDNPRRWDVDNLNIEEFVVLPEPTNYPADFTAMATGASSIENTWTDASGSQLPEAYLILCNTTGSFTPPSDGIPVMDDTDMDDDQGAKNVAFGDEFYLWTNLDPNTQYYFTIYPYTNSGTYIDYKTDGTPPADDAITDESNTAIEGDIVITEVMQNPSDVSDSDGEWFEVFNTTVSPVDLDGWTLTDNGSNSHTISGPVIVPAGGFAVLGNNITVTTNGGVPVDYEYSGFTLGNTSDAIILTSDEGVEIDRVEWDGGPDWPDPAGQSMTYAGLASEENNDGAKWIEAFARENLYSNPNGSESDQASPKTNGMFQNLIPATTWTGTGNWKEGNAVGASNWSAGSPGTAVDVTIDGTVTVDMPLINPAVCKDLSLLSDASLSIAPGKGLTVDGDLTITSSRDLLEQASFEVASDATGNGSLIVHGTITGSATVQRFFEAYTSTSSQDGWHMIGSPVEDMIIDGSDFDTEDTQHDLYSFDEPSNMWINYKSGTFPGDKFENGRGYLVAFATGGVRDFTGVLNNDVIVRQDLTFTPGMGEGYHLLANPYASSLEWNTADWTLSDVNGVAYLWDEASLDYVELDPIDGIADVIPPTNGFFVKAAAAGASVTIPPEARLHFDTPNYKKSYQANALDETLTIMVNNEADIYSDEIKIGFRADATEEVDIAFDGQKLFGAAETPQIWTVTNEILYSINRLPHVYEAYQVPMHFRPGTAAIHYMHIEGISSFYENSEIYLEDLFTGELVDLSEQQVYTFSAELGDAEDRFILHFSEITDTGEDLKTHPIQIYACGNTIYVNSKGLPAGQYPLEIFNTMGQCILSGKIAPNSLNSIRFHQKPGVYVVRMKTRNSFIVEKVLIK